MNARTESVAVESHLDSQSRVLQTVMFIYCVKSISKRLLLDELIVYRSRNSYLGDYRSTDVLVKDV